MSNRADNPGTSAPAGGIAKAEGLPVFTLTTDALGGMDKPVAWASRPCVAGPSWPCRHGRDARDTHGQDAHATEFGRATRSYTLPDQAGRRPHTGFTLLEVLAALAILGLTCSSVLLVIDRCVTSASDSALRMEAFELARENLEKILVLDEVTENVDYGTSEKYPDISWQTVVEGFPEPVTGQMWVRAISLAEYVDSTGEKRKVELVHWLTPLTDQQAGQLVSQQDVEKLAMEQVLKTDEEAAGYAKVDTDTLRQWVLDGLVRADDGTFLKYNLDVFIQAKGSPAPEQKAQQVKSVQDLALKLKTEQMQQEQNGPTGTQPGPTGLSNQQLEKMTPDQVLDLVNRRRQ